MIMDTYLYICENSNRPYGECNLSFINNGNYHLMKKRRSDQSLLRFDEIENHTRSISWTRLIG